MSGKAHATIIVRFWRVIELPPYLLLVIMRCGRHWSVVVWLMGVKTTFKVW